MCHGVHDLQPNFEKKSGGGDPDRGYHGYAPPRLAISWSGKSGKNQGISK